MHRGLLIFVALSFAVGTARGQTSLAPGQTETVKALLERIEKLEKRVADLEAKQVTSPTPSSSTSSSLTVVRNSGPQEAVDKAGQAHQHDQVAVQEAEVHYP